MSRDNKDGEATQLRLSISDNLVFVYPNVRSGQGGATEQEEAFPEVAYRPTISVCVTLDVSKSYDASRRIGSLLVQLVADERLEFPKAASEHNTITYAQHSIDADQLAFTLEPGQSYDFHAVLPVAHDVAPYELCRYGQVLPRVRATLTWAQAGNEAKTATAASKASLGKWLQSGNISSNKNTLQVQQDVWIIAVPCTLNPLDYSFTHRSVSDDLGLIILHAATQHLTIGGYMRLGLSLPAMAPECEIEQVRLTLVQSVTLKSRRPRQSGLLSLRRSSSGTDDEPMEVTCNADKMPILMIDKSELKATRTSDGNALLRDWTARLPFHGGARPSTLIGSTKAVLNIQHALELTISLSMPVGPEGRRKTTIFFVEWPLPTLASCSCRWRALRLPGYSEKDPLAAASWMTDLISPKLLTGTPPFVQFGRHRTHLEACDWSLCTCGVSLDELLQYECEQDGAEHTSTVATMQAELQMRQSSAESTSSTDEAEQRPNTQQQAHSNNTSLDEELRRLQIEQKAAQEYRATPVSS